LKTFKFIPFLTIAAVLLYSCNTSLSSQSTTTEFDIPQFFKEEVQKLQTLNPTVTKTVSNDKSSESKEIKISNWEKELAQFSTIDINKSGTEFLKESNGDTLIYSTPTDSKTKITVKVIFNQKLPVEISIYKKTQNLLFVNEETMNYNVGNSYILDKKQYVKGMGNNRYLIKGIIH